jgi:putative protease
VAIKKTGGIVEDLDSIMDVIKEMEKRENGIGTSQDNGEMQSRVLIGTVEQFFDSISVAAIKLSEELRVGDIIEMGNEEDAVRQKVTSMQIDRKNVDSATEGDSVGIKTRHKIDAGSCVYRIRTR